MLAQAEMMTFGDCDGGTAGPAPVRFDALELRVLSLVASGRETVPSNGRLHRAGDVILGRRGQGPLADIRLEALRRQAAAVLRGSREALAEFAAAGYSACHLDAVRQMMANARPRVTADRLAHAGGITLGLGAIAGFFALTAVMFTQV
jgi:hypothetical protein